MSTAQLAASPRSIIVESEGVKTSLQYAPLSYRSRGQLELLYAPIARSPIAAFEEMLASATAEDIEIQGGQPWVEDMRRKLTAASVGYEPSPEEGMAELLFLQNIGRPEGDTRDYRAAFLAVVLGARNPRVDEPMCEGYVKLLTKGQLRDIYQYALEVGPYAPK